MTKRIVVCCDGTWNTLKQQNPTNVSTVYNAVAGAAGNVRQEKKYVEGVGNNAWNRYTGGAFGTGLSKNVRDAYRFVVQKYEPGDELFFFGFSRGAYTARSTVGLIRKCGVLARRHEGRIDEAYDLYRDEKAKTDRPKAQRFRADFAQEDATPIRFIGVWDTVGALGIPLSGGRLINVFNRRWQFHNTQLSPTVQSAFQALAIDEKRRSFEPAIWDPSSTADGREREQLWFAGDHSDVGGGHGEHGLSDVALQWMVTSAQSCGLAFTPNAFARLAPNPLGTVHTMNALFRVLGTLDRPIGRKDPASESVASSAQRRTAAGLRPPYNPPNLRAYLDHGRRGVTPV